MSARLNLWSVAGEGTLCFRYASCLSLSPENAIYLTGTGRAGRYLFMGQMQSTVAVQDGCYRKNRQS